MGCDQPEIKKYTAPREKAAPDFTRLASYDVPKGWVRQAQPKEFSVATFQVGEGEGEKPVVITMSRLPGKAGGLTANIDRWRGKVGLEPLKNEQELEKSLLWLQVDGEKTPYVDLANPAKSDANRILGVVAQRGPMTWFFMMQGPPDLVGQRKSEFVSFVESVKFGGTGANDG